MDFLQLARSRYSCRKYKPLDVEDEKLNYVLEAARVAPSAVNYQPWFLVIVKGENTEGLRSCYRREWFRSANLYIVICVDHSQSWKRGDGKDHADIDAAIAADHITLAATDIGLATCWVCNFNRERLTEVLRLPGNIEPVVILPLGYPEDTPDTQRHVSKRKPLKEIVLREKFNH